MDNFREFLPSFAPLIAIGVLFYIMLIRPERRKQATLRSMLDDLKKNDRVVTIGGIRGTVVSVRREIDEVTLKVDDNTKLRVTVGSVARVETDGNGDAS